MNCSIAASISRRLVCYNDMSAIGAIRALTRPWPAGAGRYLGGRLRRYPGRSISQSQPDHDPPAPGGDGRCGRAHPAAADSRAGNVSRRGAHHSGAGDPRVDGAAGDKASSRKASFKLDPRPRKCVFCKQALCYPRSHPPRRTGPGAPSIIDRRDGVPIFLRARRPARWRRRACAGLRSFRRSGRRQRGSLNRRRRNRRPSTRCCRRRPGRRVRPLD